MILQQKPIKYLKKKDPVFDHIIKTYGIPPEWSRPEGYETLCRIILEQQVSLESGKAAYEKLNALVKVFDVNHISKLTAEEMRAATVSRQKAGYILGLTEQIKSGSISLENLSKLRPEEATEILVSIKGIGPWTAQVYLLFALQSPDIYPKGDIALINTIKELWQIKESSETLVKSEDWKPYRSTASFLLWHYYLSKRGRTNPI